MSTSLDICRQYAYDLSGDMASIGVRSPSLCIDVSSPEELWQFVRQQVVLSKHARRDTSPFPPALTTVFGKKVVELLQSTDSGRFASKVPAVGNHACRLTESRFLQATAQLEGQIAPDDPICPKPLIVTNNNQACGLLKFVGDTTLLGLRDSPDVNTARGSIYGFANKSTMNCLRSAARIAAQPAAIEYSDIVDAVGPPDILRASHFLLDPDALSSFTTLLGNSVETIGQIDSRVVDAFAVRHQRTAQRRGIEVLAAFRAIHKTRLKRTKDKKDSVDQPSTCNIML